ncbi:scavenger receptor class B member 1 [Andrena cerasifolii]|uniref:scavenger receptor class B member 1 n=1 Tax=Andrena cerasifolii TaxID=2819439 RepID=UPI00403803FE
MEKKKKLARAFGKSLDEARRSRERWFYGLAALTSICVFVVFWFTNVFRDAILSNLELRNGTAAFQLWQRPPVGLTVKIYVFNYTNLGEFESGNASKLQVQEVGPYVYRETLSRVNVEMHENETVTYQEKRSFKWISGKVEDDRVVVPNVLLMSALAFSRNLPFAMQLLLTAILSSFSVKPFLELSPGEYLWGYEDKFFQMIKPFAELNHHLPYDKFGLLAFINGVSADRITMHTGVDSLRNLGLIDRVNGVEDRKIWGDEECDRVYGTDGSIFPPQWVQRPNATLYIYAKDVCRSMPFRYERRDFAYGIPTLRYKIPSNAFTSTPQQQSCFCSKESNYSTRRTCPPAGTFNVSACKLGAPLLLSFPHFYLGDESLFQRIDGLTPRREQHESYIDLHPRLGVTVATRVKLQLNLEVRKAVGVPFAGSLEDGTILPLIWIDSGIEQLPESVQQIFYRAHYLANAIEAGCQWCSLVGVFLSVGGLIVAFRKQKRIDAKRNSNRDHDRIGLSPIPNLIPRETSINATDITISTGSSAPVVRTS